ncbi:MAG TPA: fasciclin domain-containing protein [Streptosporangiaceae bacterium]|jgi:uncharacterized surface protein with fasciclin (FAS1) repeats
MRTSRIRTTRRTGGLALTAAGLALTAACGSSSPGAAAGASPSHHPMTHPAAASAAFGSDCGMIPANGMGSMHGMMTDPVVTAAAHNPLLTTLAADIKTAGLTSALDSMAAITVFAPSDSAFTHSDMAMVHGAAAIARILKYHVVSGHVSTAQLAAGTPLTTLEGSTLKPAKMGAVYEVNNADIICGNIHTANATVYIINKVLTPAS